jgi:hypothetical protein
VEVCHVLSCSVTVNGRRRPAASLRIIQETSTVGRGKVGGGGGIC